VSRFVLKPAFSVLTVLCVLAGMIILSVTVSTLLGRYFAAPWWATCCASGVLGYASGRVTFAWMKRRIQKAIDAEIKKRLA
jgi:hypothetical protein